MKKIDTRFVTLYTSKNLIKLVVKADELNKYNYTDGKWREGTTRIYEEVLYLRREFVDWPAEDDYDESYKGYIWSLYVDCTYWDDELNDGEGDWARTISKWGEMLHPYWSVTPLEAIQYALWWVFDE